MFSLFGVDGHLLTSCMALQTLWSMSIGVCTSRLAFTRCSPSILKKKHPTAVFFHFSSQFLSFYRRGLVPLSRFKPLLILLRLSSLLWHSWKTFSARACECWIDPNASSSIQCFDNSGALGCQQWISQILRTLWLQRSSAWSILLFSWRPKATLLKFFSNSTRRLVLEERSSFGVSASGFFRSTLLRVPQVGTFFFVLGSLQAPLFALIPLFFHLCPSFVSSLCCERSIASWCNGWVFPLLLELQHKFEPQMVAIMLVGCKIGYPRVLKSKSGLKNFQTRFALDQLNAMFLASSI